jgi:hypothetical protein
MTIQHEKFGTGEILKSTEQFDEVGNIISADVMFEHGIEQNLSLVSEKLSGSQHKIDANKNGKVDAHDFKLLRGKKKDDKDDTDDSDDDEDESANEEDNKKDAKSDKKNMKESVVVTPRMTPDSASMRMPAVESVVRDIMSQQRNLRQEAKVAEFKSRNK